MSSVVLIRPGWIVQQLPAAGLGVKREDGLLRKGAESLQTLAAATAAAAGTATAKHGKMMDGSAV